jgi:hypothetical protein
LLVSFSTCNDLSWASTAANLDRGQHLASYRERRLGYGCGASAASIMHRWLARSPSYGGGQTRQATNCAPAHAAQTVAGKARRCSGQGGPVIMSASTRFRRRTRAVVSLSEPLCVSLFGPFDSTAVPWPRVNPHGENAPNNATEHHQKSLKLWLARHSWSASTGRQRLCNRAMHSGRFSRAGRSLAQLLSRRNVCLSTRSPRCVCVSD